MHHDTGFVPLAGAHNPHAPQLGVQFHAGASMLNMNVPPPSIDLRRSYAYAGAASRQFVQHPTPPLYYRPINSYQFRVGKDSPIKYGSAKKKNFKNSKSAVKLDNQSESLNGSSTKENDDCKQKVALINSESTDPNCIESSQQSHENTSAVIEVSAAGDGLPLVSLESTSSNSKEKTPMCLVNELARYNKITHQYRLTSEDGQPHKKRFTVTLNLGDEEYTSEEASIKKAQHSAAAVAIKKTNYKHPPIKVNRLPQRTSSQVGSLGNITPTVELNALAMKRGETPVYEEMPPVGVPSTDAANINNVPVAHFTVFRGLSTNYGHSYGHYDRYPPPPNRVFSQMHRPVQYYGRMANETRIDPPYKVNLVVGDRKFVAYGSTLQSARHNAAAKALDVLRPLTEDVDSDVYTAPDDLSTDIKSPISLIHEIVLKRGNSVEFHVLSEKGPPHMKTFVTQCVVGNIVTEGEGNGKKISKKRAAESMLTELRKLPPMSPSNSIMDCTQKPKHMKRKAQPVKKKARNLIKENPDEEPEDVNPISRLIHVSQIHKAKDPQYTLITEAGTPRRREFVIEVCAVNQTAQGVGSTKKQAKRKAAENLLLKMGLAATSDVTEKPKEVKDLKNKVDVVPSHESENVKKSDSKCKEKVKMPETKCSKTTSISLSDTASDEPLSCAVKTKRNLIIRPLEQVVYLSELLNFEMQVSDFPKGNHSEFLTLITLSTTPPIVCHGQSTTLEESRHEAAIQVLELLTKLGFDTVCSKTKTSEAAVTNIVDEETNAV